MPILRDTIQKHDRIGQLHRVASRVQHLERQIERTESRQRGHSKASVLTNLENHTSFNVVWGWSEGEDGVGVHRSRPRQERGRPSPVGPAVSFPRRGAGRPRRQRLDGRHTRGRAARGRGVRRRRPARGPLISLLDSALRRRAPRHPGRVGAQPRLLLQLVVLARTHGLRAQVGRGHGAHGRGRRSPPGPCMAAGGRRGRREDPALSALRRGRPARVPRPRPVEHRAMGVAEPTWLQLRQGDGMGAASLAGDLAHPRAAGLFLPGAEATGRGRVLTLDRIPTSARAGAREGSCASGRSSTPLPTARRHPRTSSPSRRPTACMSSSTFAPPSYPRWPPSGATSARGSSVS